jgi:hypothetical protein
MHETLSSIAQSPVPEKEKKNENIFKTLRKAREKQKLGESRIMRA